MTETGGTPPGWYVDNAGQRRWWDGMAWTEHVDTGQAASAGTGYGQPAYAQQQYGQLPWPPPYYLEGGPSDFGSSIRNAIHHTFEYRGRASRSSYWWFYLASGLVFLVFYGVFWGALLAVIGTSPDNGDSVSGGAITLLVVLGIAFLAVFIWLFLVTLSLTIRRLHDTSRSGWWFLISLVPFGSIVMIVFCVLESTPGPNEYNIDLTGAAHSL